MRMLMFAVLATTACNGSTADDCDDDGCARTCQISGWSSGTCVSGACECGTGSDADTGDDAGASEGVAEGETEADANPDDDGAPDAREAVDESTDADADPSDGWEDFTPPDCLDDEACNDHVWCNGRERCVDFLCVPGERVVCDDGNPCTHDLCRATLPDGTPWDDCFSEYADGDGDTYYGPAPWHPPAYCITDCDDGDPLIHPGAVENCRNDVDDDCDTLIDLDDPDC